MVSLVGHELTNFFMRIAHPIPSYNPREASLKREHNLGQLSGIDSRGNLHKKRKMDFSDRASLQLSVDGVEELI